MDQPTVGFNFHTRGESPTVKVGGTDYASWATIQYGGSNVTFFVSDAWHLVSLADAILHAANEYMQTELKPVELESA
jgi:hypothetical protein